jgi:hypothetical protein
VSDLNDVTHVNDLNDVNDASLMSLRVYDMAYRWGEVCLVGLVEQSHNLVVACCCIAGVANCHVSAVVVQEHTHIVVLVADMGRVVVAVEEDRILVDHIV